MRIFKTLYLVPECFQLFGAVNPDFIQRRLFINKLAVFEYRYMKFSCCVVCKRLCFPYCIGIENSVRLCAVNCFIVYTKFVRKCLAAFIVIETVQLLVMGIGYLCGVFTYFYLGNDVSLLILHCRQLINTSEHGCALCGDEPFSYSEGIYLSLLHHKITDKIFIERI